MDTINPFDLAVLVIVALSTFWGGMRGMISQAAMLLAWFAGLYVSACHTDAFIPYMPVSAAWKTPVAAIAAFVLLGFGGHAVRAITRGLRTAARRATALPRPAVARVPLAAPPVPIRVTRAPWARAVRRRGPPRLLLA